MFQGKFSYLLKNLQILKNRLLLDNKLKRECLLCENISIKKYILIARISFAELHTVGFNPIPIGFTLALLKNN